MCGFIADGHYDRNEWFRVHAGDSVRSVIVTDLPESERERDLAAIRDAYEAYERDGRGRIWDTGNRGFARLVRDRDRDIVDLLRRSLGPSGGRVVDVGFGDARLATAGREAALPVSHWIGVDMDPAAVREARLAAPWAEFIEGSADRLPFSDGSLDAVLASALFSSLPSQGLERAVAAEVARVLKPNGWIVWYDLRYRNPTNRAVHGIPRKRLHELFPGWQRELRTTSLLPPVARRLGLLTFLAYPVLASIPVFRSHLIGRLERPSVVSRGP
jgi:SAM-dependent methyltransferase